MNREHRRDKCAAPEHSGHIAEHKKQQKYGDGVEQNVDEMVPASFEPEQLTIEHVRNCRERMPVERVRVRESPRDSAQAQPTRHDRISVNVSLIVEVNEIVPERLSEHDPGDRDEKNANPNDQKNLS